MRHIPDMPRTAEKHPSANRLDGFDCVLPDQARAELLDKRPRVQESEPTRSMQNAEKKPPKIPAWLKSLLNFAAIVCTPVAMVAILVGIIAAFGGLKSRPSLEMQRITKAALEEVASGQPAAQTPMGSPWSAVAAYCTTGRALAITDPTPAVKIRRATPAVMRAELVSFPVRRAALLRLPKLAQ